MIIMENDEYIDQVEGRNAVLELLESERDINKILCYAKSYYSKKR